MCLQFVKTLMRYEMEGTKKHSAFAVRFRQLIASLVILRRMGGTQNLSSDDSDDLTLIPVILAAHLAMG